MVVSVIIPAYNAESFLERAVRSALAAGARVRGGYEIIIVDNASTDGTAAVVTALAAERPDVIIATSTDRPGAPAARNHGVGLSRGEWLQFLDADDTLDADKIERQLAVAGGAGWVVGAYRNCWPDGSHDHSVPHPDLWRGLFHQCRTGNTNSNLLRRSALLSVGGWNERLASNQDPELHFRLLRADVPYVIDERVSSSYFHHTGPRITNHDGSGNTQRRIHLLAAANAYLTAQRPEYWRANAPFFLGALLRAIRLHATHDLASATEAYAAYFGRPNEWAIDRPYELVGTYTRLYPYLGFRRLEALRLFLAGHLPAGLKRLLKG